MNLPTTAGPVSLRGLFVAAGYFVRDLGHVDLEQDGLSVHCVHGGIQLQVLTSAANIENRGSVVGDAASLLGSTARVKEYNHPGANPEVWGTYEVFGHYAETPIWAWTLVTPDEAQRMGWGLS